MKEYGRATECAGPITLDSEVIAAVQRVCERNHHRAQEINADIADLEEGWFRTSPEIRQAIKYDDCPVLSESTNHPDECECGGTGLVNPQIIPDVYVHTFAWYARSLSESVSPSDGRAYVGK